MQKLDRHEPGNQTSAPSFLPDKADLAPLLDLAAGLENFNLEQVMDRYDRNRG